MSSTHLALERECHFSTLLPLSVEARELSSILDTHVYGPIKASNTLETRARVWKFMQEALWIKEDFLPQHSHAFFTKRLLWVEQRMESTRERFSQRFQSVIYWNSELERLNNSLQIQYQFLLRNHLLFRNRELQKHFLNKLWDNFDQEWEIAPICKPIEISQLTGGNRKIH